MGWSKYSARPMFPQVPAQSVDWLVWKVPSEIIYIPVSFLCKWKISCRFNRLFTAVPGYFATVCFPTSTSSRFQNVYCITSVTRPCFVSSTFITPPHYWRLATFIIRPLRHLIIDFWPHLKHVHCATSLLPAGHISNTSIAPSHYCQLATFPTRPLRHLIIAS